jgi:hypothetical protein
VVTTLNKDFDVPEATAGFRELNERLARELKGDFATDAVGALSPSGAVLWPSHLAGGPLWEFCMLGDDGLVSYVPPGTPNALRNLSRAVCREMAQLVKPCLPEGLPTSLTDRGFNYNGYIAWNKDDAIIAAEWLHGKGAAIVGAELWFVVGATVQPHIRTDSGLAAFHYWTTTHPAETWAAFTDRSLNEATDFIRRFRWPDNTAEPSKEVRFCLSWVWKEWLEEGKFRFPK